MIENLDPKVKSTELDSSLTGRNAPPALASAASNSDSFRAHVRDALTNLFVALPEPIRDFAVQRFRRGVLWWLFKTYGKGLVRAPAGPKYFRFEMWLDAENYSDFIVGAYELECTRALRENLRDKSVCFDVGANLGYFSILMSRLVGNDGHVVAFEPMPDTFEVLEENIRINGLQNVVAVAAAVGDRSGSIELLSQPDQRFTKTASVVGYRLEGAAQKTSVRSIRLDELIADGERSPDLIKIDVEGGEFGVLNGARELLSKRRPTLIVEIHGWGSEASQQVLKLLDELGYVAQILEVREPEALCLAKPIRGAAAS